MQLCVDRQPEIAMLPSAPELCFFLKARDIQNWHSSGKAAGFQLLYDEDDWTKVPRGACCDGATENAGVENAGVQNVAPECMLSCVFHSCVFPCRVFRSRVFSAPAVTTIGNRKPFWPSVNQTQVLIIFIHHKW